MISSFNFLLGNKNTAKGAPEYIIAGLGNPGDKYKNTRHNAGFMAVDYIAEKCSTKIDKSKFQSLFKDTILNNKRVILLKPQTFMNNSGEAVIKVMKFYKIPSTKVIVIFDDISLNVGNIRIKRKGSHGGHNGMKSIICLSGRDDFLRVKIGVGDKPSPEFDLASWVLSDFSKQDSIKLMKSIDNTFEAVKLIVSGKIEDSMNKYN